MPTTPPDSSEASEPIVLGQWVADAHAADRAHVPTGPSPISGVYDPREGEASLLRVVAVPFDHTLRELVVAYRQAEASVRAQTRGALTMDDQYTLITFARRSAVMGLAGETEQRVGEGLGALAMLDSERIDPRDAMWAAALLRYACASRGAPAKTLYAEAATLADDATAQMLRDTPEVTSLAQWGYAEHPHEHGVGLIRAGFNRYAPTLDLARTAIDIATELGAGRYRGDVEIASAMPPIWLGPQQRETVEPRLGQALATVKIDGRLLEGHTQPGSQMFVVWIGEHPTTEDAQAIAAAVPQDYDNNGRYTHAVAHERLVAVLVAGSVVEGVDAFETPQSLAELAELCRRHLVQAGPLPTAK